MPKIHRAETVEKYAKLCEQLIAAMSPTNRPDAAAFYTRRRRKCAPSTSYLILTAVSKADEFLNGSSLRAATAEQWTDFLEARGRRLSVSTLHAHGARLRFYLKQVLDVDQLPRSIRQALCFRQPFPVKDVPPLTQVEFTALLDGARTFPSKLRPLQWQAMLWTLWDSGFRKEEMLSLRVGSLEPHADGGRLRLRQGDLNLKTGPRTIFVKECWPVLQTWLGIHPAPGDPDAYLFPTWRGDPNKTLRDTQLCNDLDRLSRHVGIRHVWPHLFRHTRATRAARDRWNESMMRKYFGWGRSSPMPSHYIHLAERDMEEAVRRDTGITPLGGGAPSEKTCPACAENVKLTANKCKHCGEWIGPIRPTTENRTV